MTARELALDILRRSADRHAFASELVEDGFAQASPAPAAKWTGQDRRLVTQLVFGVLRRRGTLDALLAPFVERTLDNVESVLVDVLRLGVFQLVFLTRIARHAAVHESVQLADAAGRPKAKGFLNGVLRKVADAVTDDFGPFARPDAVPVELSSRRDGEPGLPRYRRFTKPILPDPSRQTTDYLAAGFGWPRWLAARWLARHGPEECFRLGFWFNTPPGVTLRVNSLKGGPASYRALLADKQIEADPGEHPFALTLREGAPIRELPLYANGAFSVQDPASIAVGAALAPKPGWRVLDLCAAPGGKTTHLAEMMQNQGEIVACDIVQERLDTVKALCQRLGVTIVKPYLVTERFPAPPGPFDAVLVDVPCSNTGVLGRRPEVRWRLQPVEFEHLVRLQTQLLRQAVERVKPGGVVVYSTCSIEPDENRGVVAAVRRTLPGLVLEQDAIAIPGLPADGGYWCRLRKT